MRTLSVRFLGVAALLLSACRPDQDSLAGPSEAAVPPAFAAGASISCDLHVDDDFVAPTAPDYATIQAAITAASAGQTICVAAGTYVENISLDKSVKLYGANHGIDPNTGSRGAEAVIRPASQLLDWPGGYALVKIDDALLALDGLVIDGFTLSGDNPSLTGGFTRNGVDLDALTALGSSYDGTSFTNTAIANNIIVNFGETNADFALEFWAEATTAVGGGNLVSRNRIENTGIAVGFHGNNYASITDNVIINAGYGIYLNNHRTPDPDLADDREVSGNTITIGSTAHKAEPIGIYLNQQATSSGLAASPFTLKENGITVTAGGGASATGIRVQSIQAGVTAVIQDNDISGGLVGYNLLGNTNTAGITVSGGTVTGATYGVRAATRTAGSIPGGTYTLSGMTITGSTGAGVEVWDELTGTQTLNVSILGSTISGGAAGIWAHGTDAVATATRNAIAGQAGYAYDNARAGTQDAQCNWWGQATGPAAGQVNENTGAVDTDPWLQSADLASQCPLTVPVISALATDPASPTPGQAFTLTATATDASPIASAEYKVESGSWTAMSAVDGSFDELAEDLTASLAGLAGGTYSICVRATDAPAGGQTPSTSDGSDCLSVTVAALSQDITVTTAAPGSAEYEETFSVAATASSGLGVAITTSGGCSGSGTGSATITMTSGTTACAVAYNQAGNGTYAAAPEVTSSTTATKKDQSVTPGASTPASAAFGSSFTVTASTTSGLGVLITSSGGCTGSGTGSATITMTSGSVDCMLAYNQGGNANYDAASEVTETVQAAEAATTIQYTGQAYFGATQSLVAQLSGPSACVSGKTVTFSRDADGDGTYETSVGSGTSNGSGVVTVSASLSGGVYDLFFEFAGDADCLGASNTVTIVVAGLGDASNGGGNYTISGAGRVNFGYVAQVKTDKRTGVKTVSGNLLWHVQGKTRIKGTVTAYTQQTCPAGSPTGLICAVVVGTGQLFTWDSATESWVAGASGVSFTATVWDGGTSSSGKKGSTTTVLKPDFFGMNLPSQTVDGESAPTQIKGGNIVVK